MNDRIEINPDHQRFIRDALAEKGYEMRPDEIPDVVDSLFDKLQTGMKARGHDMTKQEIGALMLANRDAFRSKTFRCENCGREFPFDPNDPGSGGICYNCAALSLDDLPELTDEEKAAVARIDIDKIIRGTSWRG